VSYKQRTKKKLYDLQRQSKKVAKTQTPENIEDMDEGLLKRKMMANIYRYDIYN
jgi:mRNA-degrading endonuclease RelE of RelBE toxin-antitoxin system